MSAQMLGNKCRGGLRPVAQPKSFTTQRPARIIARANSKSAAEQLRKAEEDNVRLRSEAEAPFRSLRFTLFGFSMVSSGLGTLISIPQLIGALRGAGNLAPSEVYENIAINVGAFAIFAFLFRNDWIAREKQMARLQREERLGALKLVLANGKVRSVSDLRGNCRVVLVAGTPSQVESALAEAAPLREQLMRRGIFVVPLPIYAEPAAEANPAEAGPSSSSSGEPPVQDLRWRAAPQQPAAFAKWFEEQLALSSRSSPERGLYVGLRLDGRVRASGKGSPPWAQFVAEIAPLEGMWKGLGDGFDGAV